MAVSSILKTKKPTLTTLQEQNRAALKSWSSPADARQGIFKPSEVTQNAIPEAPDATVTPTQVKTPTTPRNTGLDSSIGEQTSEGIYKDMWAWEAEDNTVYGAPKPDTNDTNQDFILGYDELWEAEKQVYDMLSETEKKQFAAIGETARKAGYDMVKEQTTYLQRWKENQEFMLSQKEKTDQIAWEQDTAATTAAQQRISQSATQLRNLKQNVAFLGSKGMPWVSLQALDAITTQIAKAEKLVQDVISTEGNLDRARRLGRDVEAESFTRKLKVLQDQLDDNVNESIQDAFNELTAAQMQGKLTSFSDFEALRIKLLNNLDGQIAGITDANIQQRQFLIESFEKIAKEQQEYVKWSKQIDKEQSATQGVWVDMNGNQMISAKTGAPIPFVKDSPIDPVYNEETHELTQFSYNEDWVLTATVTKTMDDATFSQQTIAGIAKMVANKQLTGAQAEEIYPGITQMDAFRESYNGSVTWGDEEDELARKEAYIKAYDKDPAMADRLFPEFAEWGEDGPSDQSDSPLAGKDVSNLILSGNVKALALNMEYDTPYDCIDPATGRGAECGERYNDAVGIKNGTRVGDKYSDKTQFVDPSITQGEEGMGVVFNPGGWFEGNWHVGVLASGIYMKNGEAGYDVISSNYTAAGKLSKNFVPEALIANSGGGFIPTTATEEQKAQTTTTSSNPVANDQGVKAIGLAVNIFGSKVSDKEREAVESILKKYPNASASDIMEGVIQFNPTANQDVGEQLLNIAKSSPEKSMSDYGFIAISDLLSQDTPQAVGQAISSIERSAYADQKKNDPDGFVSETNVKTMVRRAKELEDLVTQLGNEGNDPIGTFEGTFQEWLGRFKGKKYADIVSKATRLMEGLRADGFGTTLTPAELEMLEGISPKISDRATNFDVKLKNLKWEALAGLNDMRSLLQMPALTEEALSDTMARIDLYRQSPTQSAPQPVSNTPVKSPTSNTPQPTNTSTTLTPEEQSEIDDIFS